MKRSFLTLLFFNGVLYGHAAAAAQPPLESAPPDMSSYLSPSQPSSSDISETRRQLLEEAGRTLGFRGGKAQRAWELRQTLDAVAKNLDALYDFRTLISRQGWLPPVISEAQDVAHITQNQIRTATHVYEILTPERFVSNPPSWRSWLNAGLSTSAVDGPEAAVIPANGAQKALWQAAVRKGWEEGRESADHTLEANFNRLTRDYRGMLVYSRLLQQGYITSPVVTEQQQTVSGDRSKLTTGDRVRRLKEHAGFVPDKTKWKPVIHREGKND